MNTPRTSVEGLGTSYNFHNLLRDTGLPLTVVLTRIESGQLARVIRGELHGHPASNLLTRGGLEQKSVQSMLD